MKKSLLYIVIATSLIALSASCNKKIAPAENEEVVEIKQPTISDVSPGSLPTMDNQIPHSDVADCHGVRKTIRRIENKKAEVVKIGEFYLLNVPPGTRRFKPCEIPEAMKIEGLKVIFTGLQLETFPNERLMGTPLRLEDISIVK